MDRPSAAANPALVAKKGQPGRARPRPDTAGAIAVAAARPKTRPQPETRSRPAVAALVRIAADIRARVRRS